MSTAHTAGEGRSLRVDSDVLGQAQPWTVTHRGLEYPGKVFVAETVNADWGRPLQGAVCFRIVLYSVPRRIPAGQIRDPRIAMAVPRRSPDPTRASLGREIQAIHEAKERYVTGSGTEIQAVRSSIEGREASLLGELARREALSYSQGHIYTHESISLRPFGIFEEGTVWSWVDRLASAVFDEAYPTRPFEYSEFPTTLTAEKIELVFRGLFQGGPGAGDTASAFGPALGLTRREAPAAFDADGCRVMVIIEEEMESRGGEMPARDLLQLLCLNHGLNLPLANLSLLAWVRWAQAEVELVPDHSIQLQHDGPFPSDRVSWDMVPEIYFTRSVADQLGVVRGQPSPLWNAALPYSNLLVEGLRLSRDETEIASQERRLLGALDDLGRRLAGSRQAIAALAPSLEASPDAALAALDQLQVLCSAAGFRGFHAVAQDSFGGPSALGQALVLHERLEQLSLLAPAITRSRRYLDEMVFGREHPGLAMTRDFVVGRIGLDGLVANPSLWKSAEESFQQLRREYTITYLSHHAKYHQQATDLLSRLETARPQVEALARFNDVPEFGGPLGRAIPKRFKELMASIRTCKSSEDEISLEAAPVCQECSLSMAEQAPNREVTLVLSDTEKAMRVYNRRLSSESVRRILAHPTNEQMDKFINLVQVGDLSPLANVLDEQIGEFLRRFVRPG